MNEDEKEAQKLADEKFEDFIQGLYDPDRELSYEDFKEER